MKRGPALTVGLTVLAMSLGGFFLLKYVSEGSDYDDGYRVHAFFNDALGIFAKSRVQTAGITIGRIETKELSARKPGQPLKAKVVVMIDKQIKMYENAAVSKKAASLLGEFFLDFDPGTSVDKDGKPMRLLREGDEIKYVIESVSFGDITDQVGTTIPIMRDILQDVKRLTSGPISEIAEGVSKSVSRNSEVLERLLIRFDGIAADIQGITSERADDVKIALANVREITEGIKKLVGTSEGQVSSTGDKLKSTIDSLQSSVSSLERSMSNIEKVTGNVADGKGTVGHLLNDDQLARNLEDVTEEVGTFVKGVTRLQTVVGLRTEYNYLANTFTNYFSIQLAPRPDKYYLIELVDDARGFRSEKLETTYSSKTGPESKKTTTITEALRFTFMFAKRMGPLTGRFGIKQSTGGAGVDLHLLDDRLALSVDVFDTRTNVFPRVQARAALAVYKRNFYIVAGADDVLNHEPSSGGGGSLIDGFFGAQLVFNDEDLKSLLLFGGSSVGSATGSK